MAGEFSKAEVYRSPQFFGDLIQHARETWGQRIANVDPVIASRLSLTQLSLIACMKGKGYTISSGAQSEIEANISVPKDPKKYIDAAAECLQIKPDTKEYVELIVGIGWSVLEKKMGEEYARVFFDELANSLEQQGRRSSGQSDPTQP